MYVSAVSVGYAVPRNDFNASVHSVFHSAVNLQLEYDVELLTIVVDGQTDLPQGIRINTLKTFSFEEIRIGNDVVSQEGILQFENGSLAIDIRKSRIWKCNLPGLMVDITNPAVASAWREVWKALGRRPGDLGDEFIVKDIIFSGEMVRLGRLKKVEEAIRYFIESTQRFDLTDTKVLETLIGLGTGLTPGFDDFLVGYLAGLWCTAPGRNERVQYLSKLGERVRQHSSRTNDISRTYLLHATRGQVSSLLFDLAKSICQVENSHYLTGKAEAAIQVGHNSGKAAVAGLLFGLAVWDGNQLLF